MATRSRAEAVQAFLDPLQQSISCVTRGVLIQRHAGSDRPRWVNFRERYVPVRGRHDLELSILHEFELPAGEPPAVSWAVRSSGYRYQVRRADGHEVIAFHWHPRSQGGQIPFPHLHLSRATGAIDIAPKAHVPTGRVSLEAVVAFLIRELGVRPLRPDWEAVLAANQAVFDASRTVVTPPRLRNQRPSCRGVAAAGIRGA